MPPKKAAAPVTGMRSISSFFAKTGPAPAKPADAAGPAKPADAEPAAGAVGAAGEGALTTPVAAKSKAVRSPSKASSEAKTSKKAKTDDEPPAAADAAAAHDASPPARGEKPAAHDASPPARGEKLEARLAGREARGEAAGGDKDEDDEPAVTKSGRPSRRAATAGSRGKRYVLESSEDEDGGDDDGEGEPAGQAAGAGAKKGEGSAAAGKQRKRIRAAESDESEFNADEASSDDDAADMEQEDSDASMDEDDDEDAAPVRKRKPAARAGKPAAKKPCPPPARAAPASISPPRARPAPKPFTDKTPAEVRKEERVSNFEKKNEGRYAWLLDQRDAKQRKPADEDFDPRTLYIPKSAYAKFSQFEKQFWDIKKENFDVVLFFKKGKFYEMFEGDADVGHRHLHLKMTDRVNMRMCGIPEGQFSTYATRLVALGFKVGRVEQMETMNAMQKRASKEKVAKTATVCERELCEILTQGTVSDESMLEGPQANFLLTVCRGGKAGDEFGVCLLEASTGVFYVGQFVDDAQLTQFETLLLRAKPREVVYPKGALDSTAIKLIKRHLANPLLNAIDPDEQFWDAERSEWELNAAAYFADTETDGEQTQVKQWPEVLQTVHTEGGKLALSAVGGCVWYLRSLKLDTELVSMKNFRHMRDFEGERIGSLVIDGQTLCNLEILENSNGTTQGTLLKRLDRCCTHFGKRKFRTWVCAPLRDVKAISARLDAAEHLAADNHARAAVSKLLRQLPDVERRLSRVHMQGSGRKQGVMFDDTGARKLRAFLQLLDSLEILCNVRDMLEEQGLIGENVKVVLPHVDFPDNAREKLNTFKTSYGDLQHAMEVGYITPERGVYEDYDAAHDRLRKIEKGLDDELKFWKKELGESSLKFWSAATGKEPYQIEIPTSYVEAKGRKLSNDLELKSQTSKVRRYWTPTIKKLVLQLVDARETLDELRQGLARRMQVDFDADYQLWSRAVDAVAHLDCLLSLSYTCEEDGSGPVCRPQLLDEASRDASEGAELELLECRHPCLAGGDGGAFVHNDVVLGLASSADGDSGGGAGVKEARACVVTGPNMGGKSTLLRQTCVAVIMAQLGAWVPARVCRMRCVDRIFTRIGASDRIMSGQSTFLVELSETSTILRHASARSLVVLDELGRGTSTYDGYAIAHAVLTHLVASVKPLLLFSTHYHTLTDELVGSKDVSSVCVCVCVCVEGVYMCVYARARLCGCAYVSL